MKHQLRPGRRQVWSRRPWPTSRSGLPCMARCGAGHVRGPAAHALPGRANQHQSSLDSDWGLSHGHGHASAQPTKRRTRLTLRAGFQLIDNGYAFTESGMCCGNAVGQLGSPARGCPIDPPGEDLRSGTHLICDTRRPSTQLGKGWRPGALHFESRQRWSRMCREVVAFGLSCCVFGVCDGR